MDITKNYEQGTYYIGRDGGLYFLSSQGGLYFINSIENLYFEPIPASRKFEIFDTKNMEHVGYIEIEDTQFYELLSTADLSGLEGVWGAIKGFFKKVGKGIKKAGKGIVKGFKKIREALRPTEEVTVPVTAPFPVIPTLIGGGILALSLILLLMKKKT